MYITFLGVMRDMGKIRVVPAKSGEMFEFAGKTKTFFPSVGLKLTGQCRLGCPFCCEPDREQEVFPVENFFKITDTLQKMGTERLCFTGGDPLLYDGLVPLLKHTKSLGFYNLLLTSDGNLLKEKYRDIIPFVNAVRFSIHSTGSKHDEIVKSLDAFSSIEEMVDVLAASNVPSHVTTVVSKINRDAIFDIAEWCHSRGIVQYYLFGLMKSGRGKSFVDAAGEVSSKDIAGIVKELESKYSSDRLKIAYYDYHKKAECILIYGDGRVVIDPYPVPPSYQVGIGNILSDTPSMILDNFSKDPENVKGYNAHLQIESALSIL